MNRTIRIRSRLGVVACFGVLCVPAAQAGGPPPDYAPMVARYARQHGVPERLVHRVIMRESRYNPRVVAHGNYGLMQIKLGTARSMGYAGGAQGLLDADVNMRHAVPYLANAYITARGDEDLAVRYYARGYYYAAKRQGLLARMRTAHSGAPGARSEDELPAQASPSRTAYAPATSQTDAGAAIAESAQEEPSASAPAEDSGRSKKAARKEAAQRRSSARVARPGPAAAAPVPPERPAEATAPEAETPEPAVGPDPARN